MTDEPENTHIVFKVTLFALHSTPACSQNYWHAKIFPSLFWVETHIYWKIHKIIHNAEFNTALTQTQQTNE